MIMEHLLKMVIVIYLVCLYFTNVFTHKSETDNRAAVPVPSRRMSLAADLMMQLERRAAESSAMFRSNVHNVVEELRPIITVARHPDPGSPQPLGPSSSVRLSLPTWLNLNSNNAHLPLSPPSSSETEDRNPIAIGNNVNVILVRIILYYFIN